MQHVPAGPGSVAQPQMWIGLPADEAMAGGGFERLPEGDEAAVDGQLVLGAVGRERLRIADMGNRGGIGVVDGSQDGGAFGRKTIDVAIAAAAEAAADGLGANDQTPAMQEGETALAGAPADLTEDHLAQLLGVHEAMGAERPENLGLAIRPRHGDCRGRGATAGRDASGARGALGPAVSKRAGPNGRDSQNCRDDAAGDRRQAPRGW